MSRGAHFTLAGTGNVLYRLITGDEHITTEGRWEQMRPGTFMQSFAFRPPSACDAPVKQVDVIIEGSRYGEVRFNDDRILSRTPSAEGVLTAWISGPDAHSQQLSSVRQLATFVMVPDGIYGFTMTPFQIINNDALAQR